MISAQRPLLLGSASPRRRELCVGLGLPIRIAPADVNEELREGESPQVYLERVVADKLRAVAERAEPPFGAILVADTTVVLGEEILGKPADVADAERLLARIVGRTHVVLTRYAIRGAGHTSARTVESRVTMRAATTDEIARYARTGEGLDKAGAYAAQGIGAFLVERIEGSYTNVIGLPVCEVVLDLRAAGLLGEFP